MLGNGCTTPEKGRLAAASISAHGMVRPCSCPSSESVWDGARSKEHRHVQQIKRAYCDDGIDIGKNSLEA
jgi:hypothetical protein